MRIGRWIVAAQLIGVLLGAQGCVTVLVQGTFERMRPTDRFDEIQKATVYRDAEDGAEWLEVRVAHHQVYVPPRFFICESPPPGDPAVVRYRLGSEARLEIAGFQAAPDPARGPEIPEPSWPVAVIQPGEATDFDSFIIAPNYLYHDGRIYELALSRRRQHLPALAAQAVTLPVTVAVDLALIPAYAVAASGAAFWDAID